MWRKLKVGCIHYEVCSLENILNISWSVLQVKPHITFPLLRHGRNTVDTTLSFRFSNLPNNAKLELQKAPESRAAVNVTIALQLEDGQRLTADFPPQTTIYNLLRHFDDAADKLVTSLRLSHSLNCDSFLRVISESFFHHFWFLHVKQVGLVHRVDVGFCRCSMGAFVQATRPSATIRTR